MKNLVLVTIVACAIMTRATADEVRTLGDGTKYLIHPSELLSGGPPPDGIPSIDEPKFVNVAEADEWLGDDELVVLLEHGGTVRMYPFQILVWHELVNDTIGDSAILITYCPLCGSAIAFEREIDGEPVEFGTSGKLYNSNLVMYDRKTGTYWSQIGGRAIIGELAGETLEMVAIQTVFWGDWKTLRPDAEVLSRETGHARSYGRDPYGSYYTDDSIWFPVTRLDAELHPKSVVYGITINGRHKAYREDDLLESGTITDSFAGAAIEAAVLEGNAVEFLNATTGEIIPFERDFWFAWAAFYPEGELYRPR